MWSHLLCIALGGALGAVSRFLAVTWIGTYAGVRFPWGTLGVNLLGSFLLGAVYAWLAREQAEASHLRSLLSVGFLGAFTTFSTFSLEGYTLLSSGEFIKGLIYCVGSVVTCLLATACGIWVLRAVP